MDIQNIVMFIRCTYVDVGYVPLVIEPGANPTLPISFTHTEYNPSVIYLILQTEAKGLIVKEVIHQSNNNKSLLIIRRNFTE